MAKTGYIVMVHDSNSEGFKRPFSGIVHVSEWKAIEESWTVKEYSFIEYINENGEHESHSIYKQRLQ